MNVERACDERSCWIARAASARRCERRGVCWWQRASHLGGRQAVERPRKHIAFREPPLHLLRRIVGEHLEVAAALVESLSERDRLELIGFSFEAFRFRPEPVPATPAMRAEALEWLGKLEAGGGTEMGTGLHEALRGMHPGAQRQVVLVSDGLIGFEQEMVSVVRDGLPLTSWVAIAEEPSVDPRAPLRRERVAQSLPHGMSVARLGLRGVEAVPPFALKTLSGGPCSRRGAGCAVAGVGRTCSGSTCPVLKSRASGSCADAWRYTAGPVSSSRSVSRASRSPGAFPNSSV